MEKWKKKLSQIRKGFYCSLCSVKNQKFFNSQEKKLILSYDFCENLVTNSVEQANYRATTLLPMINQMNIVLECKDGVENNDNFQINLTK